MENETDLDVTAYEVEETETDFGPFAVAAVALAGAATLGVVAGRNYGRVRDGVRARIAARRARGEEEGEQIAIETTAVERD